MMKESDLNEGISQAVDNDAMRFEERLAYDKLTFFYLSLPVALFGQIFGALLLSALQITSVDFYSIGIWLLLSFVMFSYRLYHYYRFKGESEHNKLHNAKSWLHKFYTNVLISGAVWGSSALLIFPEGNLINQMAIVLFLFVISFTSIGVLASKKDLLIGYVTLTFLPIILRFFFLEDAIYTNIAYIVIALMLIMLFIANYFGSLINHSLSMHQHFIEIKHSQDRLKERFFSLFERAPVGIYYYNKDLVIQDVNAHYRKMNGVEYKEDIIGYDLHETKESNFIEAHESALMNQNGKFRGPFIRPHLNDLIHVELSTVPMLDIEGEITGGVTIIKDVTEEVAAKERITRNSYYDLLTEIPNRTLLMDRLNVQLEKSFVQKGFSALLYIDLDNFKKVNDSFGHNVGDTVLKQVAYKAEEIISGDEMVARIGGDKFAILIPDISRDEKTASNKASETAQLIRSSFIRPLKTAGEDYHLTTSIGIMLFHDGDGSAFDILKRSETAMYQAKKSGRNSVVFYDQSMGVHAKEDLAIENDLHKALKNSEFEMYYQPQVSVSSGKIIGAEALIRWFHPEKGMISPVKFIPVAEKSGMIVELEKWIFEQVIKDIKAWSESTGTFSLDHMAINVSAIHFLQSAFVKDFMELIQKYAVPPAWIQLELTESEIMHNIDEAIRKIEELKSYGIRFSIDDFGTGYSSLSYLQKMPVDVLKIDQSFIFNMDKNRDDAVIVDSIINIAKKFNLTVLAEGVETAESLDYLQALDCDYFQGFHAYKPMKLSDFESAVKASLL